MLDQLYHGRWAQLTLAQQDYLRAVVATLRSDGSTASSEVAAALRRTTPQVARLRDALINRHQLLYSDGKDSLRIALPGLADWVRHVDGHHPSAAHTILNQWATRDAPGPEPPTPPTGPQLDR